MKKPKILRENTQPRNHQKVFQNIAIEPNLLQQKIRIKKQFFTWSMTSIKTTAIFKKSEKKQKKEF